MNKISLFYALAVELGVFEAWCFYPLLPARMAVHFGSPGMVNGWEPKNSFFLIMGVVFASLMVLFGALPILPRLMPASLINLPHKGYWFDPDRREDTMNRLARQLLFIGAVALFFLAGILYLSLQSNFSTRPQLNPSFFSGGVGAYMVIVLVWMIAMLRSLRPPAQHAANGFIL